MSKHKRNLLLCFDAFGTLFVPKRPIAQQYGEAARRCGIKTGLSDAQIDASFREAFKTMSRAHPNYGRESGMGAERWWTSVIEKTFQPLVPANQTLPNELAPRLLHRFSSHEGYALLAPQLPALLRALKEPGIREAYDQVVVGVVTNSDDRVPSILSSFGLRVSPLRYGMPVDSAAIADETYDVDFHCMSYDVGYEKPHRRIFEAAEQMNALVAARHPAAAATWDRVYVGDDYDKDVAGAQNACWTPVLVGGEAQLHEEANVWTLADLLSRPGRAILGAQSVETFLKQH